MTAGANAPRGGCLCRTIRYEVTAPPVSIAWCHCTMCRRASGAPATAWATVRVDSLSLLEGQPQRHASSARALRLFCPGCGSQLFFEDERTPDLVDVTVATLDAPELWPPAYHIWTSSRIAFAHGVGAGLPEHEDDGPDVLPAGDGPTT